MEKNVLFWVGVKSKDPNLLKKHGNFEYLDISKKCWEWWCDKNDVELVILDKELRPKGGGVYGDGV